MVRRVYKGLLMVALVCGLSMTFTSCKDDDDNARELTEEEKEAEAAALAAKGEAFWSVVSQLTDTKSLPDNWETATFEPSYGQADENAAFTRVMVVNSVAEAARLFSNIIETDIDENTPTYTHQHDALGSLTYSRTNGGSSLATVDVNIRQMPHLQKIVYKTIDQLGTNTLFNGRFDGGAYYRFGDVVKKNNKEGKPEYWICVRPAFSYENKGDSHWITLSALPEDNIFHHPGSNKIDYYLPKDLGANTTHEKNFAEMLYAVLNPAKWEQNVTNNRKLDMFNGFDRDYLEFHNAGFWDLVAEGWQWTRVMDRCFGGLTMDQMRESIDNDGLTLIYDSKWHTSYSWSPSIYARIYSGTNLKTATKKTYSTNVKKNIQLDMSDSYYRSFNKNSGFFGDNKPRWIIRHATGKDLGGHDKPKQPMGNGVEEVFVFNKYYYTNRNLDEDDEVFRDQSNTEHGYYVPGQVVKDPDGNRWICTQTGTRCDVMTTDYTYFISFDAGALRSGNDPLANLPSRNLAWQMLYEILNSFTNWLRNPGEGAAVTEIVTSFKKNVGIDLEEFIPMHGFNAEGHQGLVKVCCTNALYNGGANDKCIARLIYDMAALQLDGGRDMRFFAYDRYTTEPERKMMLNDLFDQEMVNKYRVENKWGDKPWMIPPYTLDVNAQFMNFTPRQSAVTETNLALWYNTSNFKFMNYDDHRAGYNMYTEPVMAFAVKRLKDNGSVTRHFEDGTLLYPYKNVNEAYFQYYQDVGVITYPVMLNNAFFINDQLEGFGIEN